MMHGVASNNTAPTTSTNMLQQDGGAATAAQTAQSSFKQDINFSIKLKDTQSSMLFSEQHQRKLEMLESRFVPLNPQKVSFFILKFFFRVRNIELRALFVVILNFNYDLLIECFTGFFQSKYCIK